MTDLTLSIDGSSTVPADNLRVLNGALESLTQAHKAGNPITVQSGSLRWRDGGVWVSVSLTMPTTPSKIGTNKQTLAQVAVDAGLYDSLDGAKEEIDVSGA
jgi:hypothetical protein